jgi:hypothetical protein
MLYRPAFIIAMTATMFAAPMGRAATPSSPAKADTIAQVAHAIAAPSDFTLFALGVSGLIIGRLGFGRRRRLRASAVQPPAAPPLASRD